MDNVSIDQLKKARVSLSTPEENLSALASVLRRAHNGEYISFDSRERDDVKEMATRFVNNHSHIDMGTHLHFSTKPAVTFRVLKKGITLHGASYSNGSLLVMDIDQKGEPEEVVILYLTPDTIEQFGYSSELTES